MSGQIWFDFSNLPTCPACGDLITGGRCVRMDLDASVPWVDFSCGVRFCRESSGWEHDSKTSCRNAFSIAMRSKSEQKEKAHQ